MQRLVRILCVALLVIVAPVSLCGCSWLQSACSKALPTINQIEVYAADADFAVSQAEAYAATLPLSDAAKAQVAAAVSKARGVLRVAEQAISTAADGCTTLDVSTVFADLPAVWQAIQSAIGGGTMTGVLKAPIVDLAPPVVLAKIHPVK